jgi:hypothetical protein
MARWVDGKGRLAEGEFTERQLARLAEGMPVAGYNGERDAPIVRRWSRMRRAPGSVAGSVR